MKITETKLYREAQVSSEAIAICRQAVQEARQELEAANASGDMQRVSIALQKLSQTLDIVERQLR